MIILVLAVSGMLLLGFSVWAWRQNRMAPVPEMPPLWRYVWRLRWPTGVVFGVAALFLHYSVSGPRDQYKVYGVPFVSYVFDQNKFDYVGPFTVFAVALNFVTWALLPQVLLWLIGRKVYAPRVRE
jgi:hypothetical protein